jgi:hypothetical protein
MRKALVLCGIVALALWAAPAYATPITDACPRLAGGTAGGEGIDPTYAATAATAGGNFGCNVLITFNSNGSITTTNPNPRGFYDAGGDDNMVGIINNTGAAINSVFLSSIGTDIFGFDGDGACDPTFTVVGGANAPCGTTTSGYGHQGVTFSPIDNFSGTVNFAGGIASGTANWFSLEGPVALDLTVTTGVPEPGSIVLLGSGLLGLVSVLRRKRV